LTLTF